jgi:exopolyphosphatase/guanosine-5'-triphosphate,3'-diphosphate pyrophosphatase
MRLAALDLGSNSFHLLVADVHPDGTFEPVTREKEMLRLGDEVSRYGRITDGAIEHAVDAVRRFKRIADADGAVDVVAKATSAIRSAENGSDVVDRIEEETGVDVDVISGTEEARLIFAAIRASVVLAPAPALCIDIGGGSVEFSPSATRAGCAGRRASTSASAG